MMTAELLLTQLRSTLAAPDPDPIEIATLAGLLARYGEPPADADGFRDAAAEVLTALDTDPIVDQLVLVEDAAEPAAADALMALDELCAGATWAGVPECLQLATDGMAAMIRAFPTPWTPLSGTASDQLARLLPKDPARELWRAIEAAQWHAQAPAPVPSEGTHTRIAAALKVGISIPMLPLRLAADDVLPPPPEWVSLARSGDWELALTRDPQGAPCLLLSTTGATLPEATFSCNGASKTPTESERSLTCAAATGTWSVRIDGSDYRFTIAE